MKRWLLWVPLCVACGGGAPPKAPDAAGSADGPEPSEASAGESREAPAAAGGGTDVAPGEATAATGGEVNKDEVQTILQLVIEDEELTPYLHLDRPDRFPLRIAGDLPAGLELTKATQPVQVVPTADAKGKPVIVFTEISVQGDRASVRYRYDVEGVRGSSTLEKREGRWVLSRSRITER